LLGQLNMSRAIRTHYDLTASNLQLLTACRLNRYREPENRAGVCCIRRALMTRAGVKGQFQELFRVRRRSEARLRLLTCYCPQPKHCRSSLHFTSRENASESTANSRKLVFSNSQVCLSLLPPFALPGDTRKHFLFSSVT
jgi:hypothetical protein